MDYSKFIVLLARQRSGTHPVRSILETHPEVRCLDEIFMLNDGRWPVAGAETNFFEWVKRQYPGNVQKLIPFDQESLFLEYLEFIHGATPKEYIVMDIKYNSTHHITRAFNPLGGYPYLFDLILKHGLRTFVLTRKNYLRYYLSIVKAWQTSKYRYKVEETGYQDRPVRLAISEMMIELNRCQAEDDMVDTFFTSYAKYLGRDYSQKYFKCDYAEVFTNSGSVASPVFLERFAKWLGVSSKFGQTCEFKKQSSLPLQASIENYQEVATALRGTKFEYCLEDEGLYGKGR